MSLALSKNYPMSKNYIFFVFFILVTSCGSNEQAKQFPNVVLVVTDDQGWGDLGIHGNPYIQTPNIDRIAKSGVQFERFYVSPVCSPTRAEILTGRYHPNVGVYSTSQGGERLNPDEKTIADVFKQHGYHTGAFGKWHNGSQAPYHPNSRGFDEFYGFCSGHWANYFSPMLERNNEIVKGEGFIADDLSSKAIEFIQQKKDVPFFTYLAFNTPHSPMQVPDKWWKKYKDIPIDTTHRYGHKENIIKTRAAMALCENIDYNIGRIIDSLENLELLENTIFIFMSDNGPNGSRWNAGLKGKKGDVDEGGVRSPFIMYWKDHLRPQKIEYIAAAIDILPTLTALVDIPITSSKPLDGKSLKPLLFESEKPWDDRYIFSHWYGKVSVRNQQYLLDHHNNIFDLVSNPEQTEPILNPSDSIRSKLISAKETWIHSVLNNLDRDREETFPVGFKDSKYTQLPARDATSYGQIKRSSKWPNASYFTNWKSKSDSITWNCDILTKGKYKATVYYTCKPAAIGSELLLKQGDNEVKIQITEAHDPPIQGKEYDRVKREESFDKEFKPLVMGELNLDEGLHSIALKASKLKEAEFIEFRLLILEHLTN